MVTLSLAVSQLFLFLLHFHFLPAFPPTVIITKNGHGEELTVQECVCLESRTRLQQEEISDH